MQNWTQPFRKAAIQRLQEMERKFASCGIRAVAGMEQELFISHPAHGNAVLVNEARAKMAYFESPFVEYVYQSPVDTAMTEIVVGEGAGWLHKVRPHASSSPSVISRAVDSVRKTVEAGVAKYTGVAGAKVDYSGAATGHTGSSLQCNISLWDDATRGPLWHDFTSPHGEGHRVTHVNPLVKECIAAMLEVQHELFAVTTTSAGAFARLGSRESSWSPKEIKLGELNCHSASLKIRNTREVNEQSLRPAHHDGSVYLENRLPGGGEEPSLVMLATFGGVVEGVERYMVKHGLPTPSAMKAHLSQPEFHTPCALDVEEFGKKPFMSNASAALTATRQSRLAAKIMGDDLHRGFCNAYERELTAKSSGMSR